MVDVVPDVEMTTNELTDTGRGPSCILKVVGTRTLLKEGAELLTLFTSQSGRSTGCRRCGQASLVTKPLFPAVDRMNGDAEPLGNLLIGNVSGLNDRERRETTFFELGTRVL